MSSFHVDARIGLKLEYELAVRLGKLILDCRPEDKQLAALGHKLFNLDEEEPQPQWIPRQNEPSTVSEWNENETPVRTAMSMREKVSKAKINWGIK